MTKEQFADLVSEMRSYQRLRELFGRKYEQHAAEYEKMVDEAARYIILGIW